MIPLIRKNKNPTNPTRLNHNFTFSLFIALL